MGESYREAEPPKHGFQIVWICTIGQALAFATSFAILMNLLQLLQLLPRERS